MLKQTLAALKGLGWLKLTILIGTTTAVLVGGAVWFYLSRTDTVPTSPPTPESTSTPKPPPPASTPESKPSPTPKPTTTPGATPTSSSGSSPTTTAPPASPPSTPPPSSSACAIPVWSSSAFHGQWITNG